MKLKLATSHNGYQNMYQRYGEDRFKVFKEHGYDYAAYAQWNTDLEDYTVPEAQYDEVLIKEAELAAAAGVKITHSHGPWRVPWKDATVEDRAERMEKMKRSVHNTRVLGAKYWVVHPIMPCDINEFDKPEAKITWELNKAFMGELLEHARKEKVVICLENMPMLKFSMGKPEAIARFIEEMNDEYFQGCLDTGHAHIFKDVTMKSAVECMGKHIKVIHAHDNMYNRDLHLYPLIYGNTDWAELGEALQNVGFDGIFELELNPPTRLPDHLYNEHARLIRKIGGRLVDKMGYELE